MALNHADGDFLKQHFKRMGWGIDVSVLNMEIYDLNQKLQYSRDDLANPRSAAVVKQLGIQGLVRLSSFIILLLLLCLF